MHQRLLLSRVIHSDDTGVKLRVRGSEDRRGRRTCGSAIGDADYPYVVFDFTADYTADGAEDVSSKATRAISRRTPWPSTKGCTARTR